MKLSKIVQGGVKTSIDKTVLLGICLTASLFACLTAYSEPLPEGQKLYGCTFDWVQNEMVCNYKAGLTGIEPVQDRTWTFSGSCEIQLTYESGDICYESVAYCYEYDYTLSFKQAGDAIYGPKLYLFIGHLDGTVWLWGNQRGGIEVWITNSELPETNAQAVLICTQRVGWS